jgi:hypothetical protein
MGSEALGLSALGAGGLGKSALSLASSHAGITYQASENSACVLLILAVVEAVVEETGLRIEQKRRRR